MKVNLIKHKSETNPDWDSYQFILQDIYKQYPDIAKHYGFGEKTKLKTLDSETVIANIKCLAVGVESVVFEDPTNSNIICKFTNSENVAQVNMRLVNNPQKNMVKVLSVQKLPRADAYWIQTQRLYDSKKLYKRKYFFPYYAELYKLLYHQDLGVHCPNPHKYKHVSLKTWAEKHAKNTLKSWSNLGVNCGHDYVDLFWDHNILWSKYGVPTLFDFGVGYDVFGKKVKIPIHNP